MKTKRLVELLTSTLRRYPSRKVKKEIVMKKDVIEPLEMRGWNRIFGMRFLRNPYLSFIAFLAADHCLLSDSRFLELYSLNRNQWLIDLRRYIASSSCEIT